MFKMIQTDKDLPLVLKGRVHTLMHSLMIIHQHVKRDWPQRGTILYVMVVVESMHLLLGTLMLEDILAKIQDMMVAMMMDMAHTN